MQVPNTDPAFMSDRQVIALEEAGESRKRDIEIETGRMVNNEQEVAELVADYVYDSDHTGIKLRQALRGLAAHYREFEGKKLSVEEISKRLGFASDIVEALNKFAHDRATNSAPELAEYIERIER